MDAMPLLARLDAALANQVALAGGDPAVEAVAAGLRNVLEATVRQSLVELAEQAALEVSSQLPAHDVRVVIVEGEPTLELTPSARREGSGTGDYEARLTLRLPEALKGLVDSAASTAGESVNSWVVNALSSTVERPGSGASKMKGTVRL